MMNSPAKNNRKNDWIQLILGLAMIIFLNIISSFIFTRVDLTSEKRFTISPATKTLLKDLKDVVHVKIYLEGEFPAPFKKLRNATKEMLDEFRAYAGDNLTYEFINPSASNDQKERIQVYNLLADKGLQPTNLNVKSKDSKTEQFIFPGAIVSFGTSEYPVQLLKSRIGVSSEEMLTSSIEGLEYELANAIKRLTTIDHHKVAFLDGQGELDTLSVADIYRTLQNYYEVNRVTIGGQLNALDGINALIIAKPTLPFTEYDKFIIDQFVMKGGKIFWLVDMMRASMDSLSKTTNFLSTNMELNLDDILFKYGVRINPDLVQDEKGAPLKMITGKVGNQNREELKAWFYFPLVIPTGHHPIVNALNAVRFEFSSSLDTISVPDVKKTILLTSSDHAKSIYTPVLVSFSIMETDADIRQFNQKNIPLAVLLEGKFQSLYKGRIPKTLLQNSDFHFTENSKQNKMIVVADGDVIKNTVLRSKGMYYPLEYDRNTNQYYGNKNFIINALDYLLDDSGLITVRAKQVKLRLLDKTIITEGVLKWQILNIAIPIFILIVVGIVWNLIRRRRFT